MKSFLPQCLLAVSLLGLQSEYAIAEGVGTVKQLGPDMALVAIELAPDTTVTVGERLVLTLPGGKQCRVYVRELKAPLVMADTTSCESASEIAVGTIATKDLFKEEAPVGAAPIGPTANDKGSESEPRNESWYTYWGFGFSSISYSGDVGRMADAMNRIPGIGHSSVNLDLFGFYWPVAPKTMTGVVLNISGDRWSDNLTAVQANQYLVAWSTMSFFGQRIGEGFFTRFDVGASWFNFQVTQGGRSASSSSNYGIGVLGGLGYAVPLSPETRLLMGGNYSYKAAGGYSSGVWTLSVGLLF